MKSCINNNDLFSRQNVGESSQFKMPHPTWHVQKKLVSAKKSSTKSEQQATVAADTGGVSDDSTYETAPESESEMDIEHAMSTKTEKVMVPKTEEDDEESTDLQPSVTDFLCRTLGQYGTQGRSL